jgi:hypothetical protein
MSCLGILRLNTDLQEPLHLVLLLGSSLAASEINMYMVDATVLALHQPHLRQLGFAMHELGCWRQLAGL